MTRFWGAVLLLAGCVTGGLFAASSFRFALPFTIKASHDMGAGGPHIANSTGVYALFTNPAALAAVQENSVVGFGLGADINGKSLAAIPGIIGGKNIDRSIFDLWAEHGLDYAPPDLHIQGPLFFGYTGKGRGLGVFNRSWLEPSFSYDDISGNTLATYRVDCYNDIIAVFGASANLTDTSDHQLEIGYSIKACYRMALSFLSQTETFTTPLPTRVEPEEGVLPAYNYFGAGLDIGLLYRFMGRFSVGVSINDALTGMLGFLPESPGLIDAFLYVPRINAGIALDIIYTREFIWTLTVDYRDALHSFPLLSSYSKDPLLGLGLGLEFNFLNNIKIRCGLMEMLPTAGLGIEYDHFKLNIAYYNKEYGRKAGVFSSAIIEASVLVTVY